MYKKIMIILLLVLPNACWSQNFSPWYSKGESNQTTLRVDLFLSSTCPHCQKADAFFRNIELEKPWLDVHRYFINQDKAALDAFQQELQHLNIDDYAVPAIFFCNSRWVGFDDAKTTGQNLLRGLDFCKQEINKKGSLQTQTVALLKQLSTASWFDANMVSNPSLSLFTVTMALTDAFGPCSLFCILALFAFLWLHKNVAVMVGITSLFLFAIMVVHHFHQDHTLFFYQVLSFARIPAALIGVALIVYMGFVYFKGTSIHPSFVISILIVLIAALLQAYQQNCTPNFGIVYQQWLDAKNLTTLQGEMIEVIYQIIYVLPLALFAVVIIYFHSHTRLQKLDQLLTYVAWSLLLIIGVFLIFFPQGLSSFIVSLASLFLSLLAGWLSLKKSSRLK